MNNEHIVQIAATPDTIRVAFGDEPFDQPTAYRFNPIYLEAVAAGSASGDALARAGLDLYEHIFSTTARRQRLEALLGSMEQGDRLVLVVNSEHEGIHNTPFELFNRDGTAAGFLLKQGNVSMVRGIPSLVRSARRKSPPFRVLIVLSMPLEVYAQAPLDLLRELDMVYKALKPYIGTGMVVVDVEEKASKAVVRERLLRGGYDVVHFAGHGVRGGRLVMEDDEGCERAIAVGSEELRRVFGGSGVRVFIFDACETARSTDLDPSLGYHIYQSIPSAHVIANTMTVKDAIAAEITAHVYAELFGGSLSSTLDMARLRTTVDWWKPVIFSTPGREVFDVAGWRPPRSAEPGVFHVPPAGKVNNVYRFSLVREASQHMDRDSHLLLHGIGGAGKSTMAAYMARFFRASFQHVVFVDLTRLPSPDPTSLVAAIGRPLGIEAEERDDSVAGWRRIEESLGRAGHGHATGVRRALLLVLDNLEGVVRDERGRLHPAWRDLLEAVLASEEVFTILTSRLRFYLTDRRPMGNVLEIGDYTPPELSFLFHSLNRRDQEYFAHHIDAISGMFGLHPLSIAKALDEKPADVRSLLRLDDIRSVFEFYRPYLETHRRESAWLFSLPFPATPLFLDHLLPAEFLSTLKTRLLLLQARGDLLDLCPVVRAYFSDDFRLEGNDAEALELAAIQAMTPSRHSPFDLLNILAILVGGDDEQDTPLPEAAVAAFNSMGEALQFHLREKRSVVERFAMRLAATRLAATRRAATLNNLGALYHKTAQPERARQAYAEALSLHRTLAAANAAHQPGLAGTLSNLGALYLETERPEEAEEVLGEAIAIYRQLSAAIQAHRADLTTVLTHLGLLYRGRRLFAQAKEALSEAQRIMETLATTDPAYQAGLAMSLNNLGLLFDDEGRRKEAEKAYIKARDIYRAMASSNRAHNADLALVLTNLGALYGTVNQPRKAGVALTEACDIYRVLAATNQAYRANLAAVINNLGNLFWSTRQPKEAEAAYVEARDLRRQLAAMNPADRPDYAATLNNLGVLYSDTGRPKEAEEAYTEARDIRRDLAARNTNYRLHLAKTLANLGNLYAASRRPKEAEEAYTEARDIYRAAAAANAAVRPDLAAVLTNWGNFCKEAIRLTEAEEAYAEACGMYRALVASDPTRRPDLAAALNNLGLFYADTSRPKEAEETLTEALEIRREGGDYREQLRILPFLIPLLAARIPIDYRMVAREVCAYLETSEALSSDEAARHLVMGGVQSLLQAKPFAQLDMDALRQAIPYPVCRQRLDRFLTLLKSLSPPSERV